MNERLVWVKDMHFVGECRGHEVDMDTTAENGGHNLAPSPKELVLHGMAGCTAMDVVSILKKMRQKLSAFAMEIEVEKNKSQPIYFTKAKLIYKIEGEVERQKAQEAIDLSLTKYCGVNYMISKVCQITYELELNGKKVAQGAAHFQDPAD